MDGWLFRVNSHRARGPEYPLAKPAGEKRLVCIGDSFAFGLWADEDETLVGHLARLASEAEQAAGSGIRWRGISLGVPGYHAGQQRRALEQDALRLDPDVVVLYYNTNDILRDGFFLDEELGALRVDQTPLPVGLRRLLWHSHLYGFLVREVGARSRSGAASPHLDPDNQAYAAAAIREMAALCRAREVPLFFVNQPLYTWMGDARRPDWWVLPLVQWAEELREELGLPGYSLLGFLRGYADGVDRLGPGGGGPKEDFFPDRYIADEAVQRGFEIYDAGGDPLEEGLVVPEEPDFHLTGEGYGHMARLVYPAMREAGLVP